MGNRVMLHSRYKNNNVTGKHFWLGDEVLQVGGSPSQATITGNPDAQYFGVFGYNPGNNLLVNTTDVYQGTVRVAQKQPCSL